MIAGRPVRSVRSARSGTSLQPGTFVSVWTMPFTLSTKPGSPTPIAATSGCPPRSTAITRSISPISVSASA